MVWLTAPTASPCVLQTLFVTNVPLSLRSPALIPLLNGSPFLQSIIILRRKECELRGVFVQKNFEGKFLELLRHSADSSSFPYGCVCLTLAGTFDIFFHSFIYWDFLGTFDF